MVLRFLDFFAIRRVMPRHPMRIRASAVGYSGTDVDTDGVGVRL
jgi:hypothetical protein